MSRPSGEEKKNQTNRISRLLSQNRHIYTCRLCTQAIITENTLSVKSTPSVHTIVVHKSHTYQKNDIARICDEAKRLFNE